VAGEFQADHRNPTAPLYQQIMREHVPAMSAGGQLYAGHPEQVLLQSAASLTLRSTRISNVVKLVT